MNSQEIKELKEISLDLRKNVVEMAFNATSSHVGTALSMIDILNVLYNKMLNVTPDNYKDINRDKFILSKGHGSSGLYSILAHKGFFDKELLSTYYKDASPLSGHPKRNSVPGVEVSSGSLGHGLSMGCGIALSDKHENRTSKTVVLMGDGECNEGSVYEAMMFASSRKLNNLIVIIDNNELQALGRTREVTGLEPIMDKFKAFGWNCMEIDGHDFEQIYWSLSLAYRSEEYPTAIIAHTVKGKGVSFMEDRLEWHYKSPNDEQLKLALKELE